MSEEAAFHRISPSEWRLLDAVPRDRAKQLLQGMCFEEVATRAVDEAILISHKRARAKSNGQFVRVVMTIQVNPTTVDLFHNSACGYRAQYLADAKTGERANFFAVASLAPRILEVLRGHAKRTCPLDWVAKSISSSDAKVWIHQGHWWRFGKTTDQVLQVERWVRQRCSADPERRKKARWGSLAPASESRIDLKGAFFSLGGEPLVTMKPTRASDIHDLGFT